MAKIGVLLNSEFDDVEYIMPAEALENAGHELIHIGEKEGVIEGMEGTQIVVDQTVNDSFSEDFDALFIPESFSPRKKNLSETAEFVADFIESGKPIFVVGHNSNFFISKKDGQVINVWKTFREKDFNVYLPRDEIDKEHLANISNFAKAFRKVNLEIFYSKNDRNFSNQFFRL